MKQQDGSILLISLLFMAAILATSIGFSTMIIGQLRVSENYSSGMLAYYAAESGIERGLWRLKYGRNQGETFATAKSKINENNIPIATSPSSLYTITANESQESLLFPEILSNRSVQIDLFPIDNGSQSLGISELQFSWKDSCNECSRIEITKISWPDGSSINMDNVTLDKEYRLFSEQKKFFSLARERAYSIRFKNVQTAGDGSVLDFRVSALNSDKKPVSLSSYVSLASRGVSGQSAQAIQALVPFRVPATSLLDYVLFSEKGIDK